MATAKPVFASDVSEIQQRMAQIRHDMHQEVRGAVKGAHSLTDWKSLVANYPWLSLGVAATVGYLVVPWRATRPQALVSLTTAPELAVIGTATEQRPTARRPRWKAFGVVSGLLVPVVLRAAQNYALNYFEQWLAAHPLNRPQPVRDVRPSQSEHKPAGPGFQGTRFRESR
jgi:hypothetical protein